MSNVVEAPIIDCPPRATPVLRDGARLSRAEFRRLRELHPEIKRVERIDGVVVMPAAAVRVRHHGQPHSRLTRWIGAYENDTECVASLFTTTVSVGASDDPEPDAMLYVLPEHGGNCQVTEEDYLEGSPEFLGEVSGSTAPKDLGRKLRIYEENGVEEYLVGLTEIPEIRWLRLRDGKYEPLAPDAQGIVRSEVFPGLWLDVPAMLRGDMRRVLAVLNEGLATPEHAAFVARLEAATRDAAARRAEGGGGTRDASSVRIQ